MPSVATAAENAYRKSQISIYFQIVVTRQVYGLFLKLRQSYG